MNQSEPSRVRRLLSYLLVAVLVLSLAGCKERVEPEPEPEPPPEVKYFINALPLPDKPDSSALAMDNGLRQLAAQKHDLNQDTIGWLQVPGTSIDDPVLFYPSTTDKFYYLRRDFDGNQSWEGSYFVDYRSQFEGAREGMSRNTVIYGHSMEDDENFPLFTQLKKYRRPDFAEENPYLYFSTLDEDIAWEVFAVFITTTAFKYNVPNPDDATFQSILDGARSRSLYTYEDVEVGMDDKILTLSTCTYYIDGAYQGYPNAYRYVVMARQVPATEALKETAVIVQNPAVAAP